MTQVHLAENKHASKENSALYASKSDFCRIFAEDMNDLYLLSLLLTADPEKAEQCFVSGLDDCADGNQVFKEWARSWARRSIIKNAIRMVAPQPEAASDGSARKASTQHQPEFRVEMSAMLELDSFERFAFVMSVLEGYSDRECALLLNCTRDSMIEARSRALQQVARSVEDARAENTEAVEVKQSSIAKLGALLAARPVFST
jgi:DNA-directed RNA polymerase specialized sigma24 family protein